MNDDKLTSALTEVKKVLAEKMVLNVSDKDLTEKLNKCLNLYHMDPKDSIRSVLKEYGAVEAPSPFVTGNAVSKKIKDLTGTEMNVDITAKAIFVDRKEITVRTEKKVIVSGILGDETGTAPFTIWDDKFSVEKGVTYIFRNVYTKTWNNKVQINLGTRGKVEKATEKVDVPERTIFAESSEVKIGEIREGIGNVTVTGRILSVETRNITVKDEPKTVWSGLIADDTGKVQFSAWNDFGLKANETLRIKDAYVKSWRGIPQLNMGDKCTVARVDDSFGDIASGPSDKCIADIVNVGGALDVSISGTVVDLRTGSGLIKRCPECNRSILGDDCSIHGKVTPVMDLRMKLVVDDGTGAISAIVNRADTEKLTGITLAAATGLAKAKGETDIVARDMAGLIIMKKVTISGNVMSDEYGPMMIVRSASENKVDITAEAEKLYKEMEAVL